MYIVHTTYILVFHTKKNFMKVTAELMLYKYVAKSKNLWGQVVMQHAVAARRRLLKILKNCQNGTFLPMHENQKIFRPNVFI